MSDEKTLPIRDDEAPTPPRPRLGRRIVLAFVLAVIVVGAWTWQRSRVARNALPSTPAPVDLSEALEWTGLFLFQATPLGEAAAQLGDRYDVSISVAPGLEAEGVSGTFAREQSLQQILTTLATTLNATVEGNDADGYTIGMAE